MSDVYKILEVKYSVRQELVPQSDPESKTSVEESVLVAHASYELYGSGEYGHVIVPLGKIATKTTVDDGYGNPKITFTVESEFVDKLKKSTPETFMDSIKKVVDDAVKSSANQRLYETAVKQALGFAETRAQYDNSRLRYNPFDPFAF